MKKAGTTRPAVVTDPIPCPEGMEIAGVMSTPFGPRTIFRPIGTQYHNNLIIQPFLKYKFKYYSFKFTNNLLI